MSSWLGRLAAGDSTSEQQVIARYSDRLLALARRRLPARLRSRVDPEDILQSVYRSFFRRLKQGELCLDESHDLWRLLVTITYYKVCNSVKFHHRECRDVRREIQRQELPDADVGERQPTEDDVDVLQEFLEKLLNILPENAKDIVVRRLNGETLDEIAGNVKRSRRTVIRVLGNVQNLAAELLEASA